MNSFQADLLKESILAEFLDDKYKSQLNWSTVRVADKLIQKLGVDFLLCLDGIDIRVDEKAQLSYLNEQLPTFALEIDYLINGNEKEGWLFDSSKYTDFYAFVFCICVNNKEKVLKSVEDIVSCEVVFVNRLKLINELSKLGLTAAICKQNSLDLRAGNLVKLPCGSKFNFHISRQLSEQPVNLVVTKTFLEGIGKKFVFNA